LAYNAWLDHYRGTGAARYLEAAKGAWQIVHDNYLHVGGTLSICEGYDGAYPPGSYFLNTAGAVASKNKGRSHTGETCGSIFWTDINHRFLQFFPDQAKYADEIEKEIVNVLWGVQDSKGDIRYHSFLVDKKSEATCINTCCEVFGSSFFGRSPEYIYSVADDGLYVNLYVPSTITCKQGGQTMVVKQETAFPYQGAVSLTVSGLKSPVSCSVRVRIPGWAAGDVAVQVNGAVAATGKPGTFVVLDRRWQNKDTVTFELPMAFRTVHYTGMDQDPDRERYALLYGPLLMALVGADDLDIPFTELAGRLKPMGQPADGGTGDTQLRFTVQGMPGVHYQPYWQIQDEVFTCFPTMR
jgi:DUF1680 family protein